MLRVASLVALAAATATIVSAHGDRKGPHYCSELDPETGLVRDECASQEWVTKFSVAAAGPEQVRFTRYMRVSVCLYV
jgi:hypothetical protein